MLILHTRLIITERLLLPNICYIHAVLQAQRVLHFCASLLPESHVIPGVYTMKQLLTPYNVVILYMYVVINPCSHIDHQKTSILT